VSIHDSIPAGFSLVSGSVKNCYSDLSCVNLNDNLFSSSNLNVAPLAGYYGYPTDNTSTSGNLEIGRKKYVKVVSCNDTSGLGDEYIPYTTDGSGGTLGVSNLASAVTLAQIQSSQSGYCTTSGSTFSNGVLLARGNRYIQEIKCQSSTSVPYFGDWKIPLNLNPQGASLGINNTSTSLTQSDILYSNPSYCTGTGQTFTSQTLDLLGKRYIHQIKCDDTTYFGDMYIPSNSDGLGGVLGVSNNSTPLTLAQIQATDPSFCTGSGQSFESNIQDTLDTGKGYGYIEYRMTAPSYGGIFGTDASMSGGFSANAVTASGSFTISVGTNLTCPYLMPAGGVRNVNLGDAELRADQDFTCNYTAKVCVNIFQDDNVNGIQDNGESRIAGVTIDLLTQDESSIVYNLISTSTGTQCFEPLQNNTIYRIRVMNPPTPYSTTGGDYQDVGVTYQSGIRSINFGYGTGSISLSAEHNVTLGNIQVSPNTQNICTVIHDIQVIDTRLNKPGWSVNATVNDFVDQSDSSNIITSAGRVQLTPQTLTVVGGSDAGVFPGQTKTISSTSDPAQVFSATSSNGNGTYKTNMQVCLSVPPFTKLGQYTTTVNFVV
jgi:hypothetical protein